MALGSTQPPTEMSTRNIPGGKGRPAPKADNFTAICEPIVWTKCGSLDVPLPYGPPWPVTGIALPYLVIIVSVHFKLIFATQYTKHTLTITMHIGSLV
jgi:hypothetical protein